MLPKNFLSVFTSGSNKMLFPLLTFVVLLSPTVYSEKARFDYYKVFRVVPASEEQVHLLHQLQTYSGGLVFWNDIRAVNTSVDIMVPPHKIPEFHEIMDNLQANYKLIVDNVQTLVDNSRVKRSITEFGWEQYHTLEEVYAWLDEQVEKFPSIVSPLVSGKSYEGREIRGVKVSYKTGNPGVFIESGIHAREWITVATVTYILNELLTSEDAAVRNIAENYDWYIFPSTNPDGYVYSHTTDRMWRKTRSPGVLCRGTDPNRNWDYYWMDAGASNDPCTQTYAGNRVFSEVEVRTLADYVKSIAGDILVYLDFHNSGQLLMIPYGLNYELSDNHDTLMEIGTRSIEALAKRYGTEYKLGTIHDIIYPASGSSIDWIKKALKIPYTFVWELRDQGLYGFLLPEEQIIPTAEETLDSVISILEDVQKLENLNSS